MNPTTELLRPYRSRLIAAAQAGDEGARQVITLYGMYQTCPGDMGAAALCEAAFKEWINAQPKQAAPVRQHTPD